MVKDQGLYAQEEIEPWKVLLSINKKDVLCFSNIPNQFK